NIYNKNNFQNSPQSVAPQAKQTSLYRRGSPLLKIACGVQGHYRINILHKVSSIIMYYQWSRSDPITPSEIICFLGICARSMLIR
ncbi:Hypothetical predicted protein, partial [Paramuricea clavata]